MSGGVGGWASCDVPGVESGDVFGSVREKRLFAGDGALGENWASCSDRLGSKRPEKPQGELAFCQIYGRAARATGNAPPKLMTLTV